MKTLAICIVSVLLGVAALAIIMALAAGFYYIINPFSELFYATLLFLPIGGLGYVIYLFITGSKRNTKMKK